MIVKKIKKVNNLGFQNVYDLTMPTNHNFVSESGQVLHNCSYGIVSYFCAYMKINYPLYYWLGFLSINTNDHDTLRHYLKECGDLVLPVDLLKSHSSEWRIEGNKLRAPMSLMKGCGEASMAAIQSFLFDDIETLRAKKSEGELIALNEENSED